MKIWIKRYFILFICLLLGFLPILTILNEYDIIKTDEQRIIFWIISVAVVCVFFIIMTIFMIIGHRRLNNKEKK